LRRPSHRNRDSKLGAAFFRHNGNFKKRSALSEEKEMEDFPIWLKLMIWGTIGLTVGYTIWGMITSFTQS
jgi:hypothetical protein